MYTRINTGDVAPREALDRGTRPGPGGKHRNINLNNMIEEHEKMTGQAINRNAIIGDNSREENEKC